MSSFDLLSRPDDLPETLASAKVAMLVWTTYRMRRRSGTGRHRRPRSGRQPSSKSMSEPMTFDDAFRMRLRELFAWRRDVRRFRRDPLPSGTLERLIEIACLAPSVGLSQPWR